MAPHRVHPSVVVAVAVACALLVPVPCHGTLPLTPVPETHHARRPTNPSDPNITALECGMRRLALAFAQRAQPWLGHRDTFDALQLESMCGDAPPPAAGEPDALPPTAAFALPSGTAQLARTFFVATNGSDASGTGSLAQPFRSIDRALVESRAQARAGRGNCTIVIRGGIHYLDDTVRLASPLDDALTITNFPGERAWVSGGVALNNVTWTPVSSGDGMPAGVWKADLSSYSRLLATSNVTGLFTSSPHRRLTLARYPNADAETNDGHRLSPSDVLEWTRPPVGQQPTYKWANLSDPRNPTGYFKNDSAMSQYNTWGTGYSGVCTTVWGPEPSYWCGNASAGGWAFVDNDAAATGRLNLPVGMHYDASVQELQRLANWSDPAGGILHAWHSQSWAMHMFEISAQDKAASTLTFSRGGWQGGRNWCRCDQCPYAGSWCGQHKTPPQNNDTRMISGQWFVENIKEELDIPTEFWFHRPTNMLYLFPNVTDSPAAKPGGDGLVVTALATLIDVRADGVTIQGLGFRDARKTFMDQHVWGAPSGGDWALGRVGAVFLENSTRTTVQQCTFRRLDGNALFLSRRNRDARVLRNDFAWVGDGAMATWGDTDGWDATGGDQPRGSLVADNYVRELGLYEKQSSGWGQAKTCQTTLQNNIMFNVPRAAINFNDNLGGGNSVEGNLLFSTCRESGDHGAMNTWDREPFLTAVRDGRTPSFTPALNNVTRNLIFANYGSSQGVDNDDGSSWYHTFENVFYSADGFKMDYGGHDSAFTGNLVIGQPGGYDGQNCFNVGSFEAGHGDEYANNTCVVLGGRGAGADTVAHVAQCNTTFVDMHANAYYTPHGNASISCAQNPPLPLPQVQAQYSLEAGSTFAGLPSADDMVRWAHAWLRM